MWDRHSVVSIKMLCELDSSKSGGDKRLFSSPHPPIQLLLPTRFSVKWVPVPFLGMKLLGTEMNTQSHIVPRKVHRVVNLLHFLCLQGPLQRNLYFTFIYILQSNKMGRSRMLSSQNVDGGTLVCLKPLHKRIHWKN